MAATRTNLREVFRPGPDRLVHVAVGKSPERVVTRVYGPNHSPIRTIELDKLEPTVFAFDFNFREIGNYIFVIEEDGEVTTVLNAKVYA